MKRYYLLIIILILPFLLLLVVNEGTRNTNNSKPFEYNGYHAINSNIPQLNTCTWTCHFDTDYCKSNHLVFLKNYTAQTDRLYFGMINSLKSTKSYAWANVLCLVMLWPLFMFFLVFRIIMLNSKIKNKLRHE